MEEEVEVKMKMTKMRNIGCANTILCFDSWILMV